jgi:hypothetical protein
MTFQDGFHYCK